MREAIGVLNAGSSSLKFCMYEVRGGDLSMIAGGQIESLGTRPRFKAKDAEGNVLAEEEIAAKLNHEQAFDHLSEWLRDSWSQQFKLIAIGHRIVHGGTEFIAPTEITPQVLERLKKLIPLAPLHQPYNLQVIETIMNSHPQLMQVGCFDTAFHQGREEITQRFGLPDEYYHRGIRRWGFHGLSYESIAKTLKAMAPQVAAGRVIVAHLGSGASLCAMKDGRSVDTTMSFSTLDGLPMGTRCGSLDPGVVLWLLETMTPKEVEDLLYHRSGLLGLSGMSNDVRELLASSDPRARLAIDYFVYRIAREVGSLVAALGGLDAIVFTAGIGENSPVIRKRVCDHLKWLGVEIEEDLNDANSRCLSRQDGLPSVWVIPTDEEKVIAMQTMAILHHVALT